MNIALSSWAKWLLALLLGVGLATGVLGTTGAQAASASASTPPAINALSQAPGGTTTMVAGPPAGSGSESGLVGNILPSDGVPAGTPSDGQYEVMYSTGGGLFAPADVGHARTPGGPPPLRDRLCRGDAHRVEGDPRRAPLVVRAQLHDAGR